MSYYTTVTLNHKMRLQCPEATVKEKQGNAVLGIQHAVKAI